MTWSSNPGECNVPPRDVSECSPLITMISSYNYNGVRTTPPPLHLPYLYSQFSDWNKKWRNRYNVDIYWHLLEMRLPQPWLWKVQSYSPAGAYRRFGITYCVHILGHSSILKIEAVCSSETSSDFPKSTRCHTPEDSTVQVISGSEVNRIIDDVNHRKEGINIVIATIVGRTCVAW